VDDGVAVRTNNVFESTLPITSDPLPGPTSSPPAVLIAPVSAHPLLVKLVKRL
jgi:hypothetical protein